MEGTECPFPVVRLAVRDRYGTVARLYFRVDTQADFTPIPVETTRQHGIPYAGSEERQRTVGGLGGSLFPSCRRAAATRTPGR
jgi:hypothetical protein